MNAKNSLIKNNINLENKKQNDNEAINNFSNVNKIEKNKKRQNKKKPKFDSSQDYNSETTKSKTNELIDTKESNIDIPNLLEQHNENISRKELKTKIYLYNKNKNINNIPLEQNDIINEKKNEKDVFDEEDIEDYDYNKSKEEDKIFKADNEKIIKKIMENTDKLIIIPNFNILDESKINGLNLIKK
jgi:hypothetical protein